ncbi:MAG: hypothetical protein Q8K85_22150, partial [Hyphomicrobium sp.]|nr:hypothetical protein [Hyphomicrobium sp.]
MIQLQVRQTVKRDQPEGGQRRGRRGYVRNAGPDRTQRRIAQQPVAAFGDRPQQGWQRLAAGEIERQFVERVDIAGNKPQLQVRNRLAPAVGGNPATIQRGADADAGLRREMPPRASNAGFENRRDAPDDLLA